MPAPHPRAAQKLPRGRVPRPRLRKQSLTRRLINSLFFIWSGLIFAELALPRSSISGQSMEPTLLHGQYLLISRVHYLLEDPKYGDIAVFDNPRDNNNDMLIKRVIGVPGDTVEFRREYVLQPDGSQVVDMVLYLNGERVEEPYFVNRPCSSICAGIWTVGPDEYFMVGDNRSYSNDSRNNVEVGLIPREKILGKAIWRHLPASDFGPVE